MWFPVTLFHFILCCIFCLVSCLKSQSIKNGTSATLGQFPYHALVKTEVPKSGKGSTANVTCSGSVLNERWILTTAKCIVGAESPASISVIVGTINSTGDHVNETIFHAENFFRHGEFDIDSLQNNVALIYLDSAINYSETVAPIEIPDIGYIAEGIGNVTGWALTTNRKPTLMYNESAILGDDFCEQCVAESQMGEEEDYTYNRITNLCTFRPPCEDNGSPFAVTDDGGRHLQMAMISTHIECNETKISIYMELSQYSDWISYVQAHSMTSNSTISTSETSVQTSSAVSTTSTTDATSLSATLPISTLITQTSALTSSTNLQITTATTTLPETGDTTTIDTQSPPGIDITSISTTKIINTVTSAVTTTSATTKTTTNSVTNPVTTTPAAPITTTTTTTATTTTPIVTTTKTTTITTRNPFLIHTTPNTNSAANTIAFERHSLFTILSCTLLVLYRL